MIDRRGHIVNQQGKYVFDVRQLRNGCIQPLINWRGAEFPITDVMGTFKLNEKNKIQKFAFKKNDKLFYKDLSGHLVNEKGYLINSEGHIVNRKGKVLFYKFELKCGEFPKIFSFSKFDLRLIKGTFKRDGNKKPILK